MINYYDLKSSKSLPPRSRFVDPYDLEPYVPVPNETLSDFINRVKDSRAKKGAIQIVDSELQTLIIESLYEHANIIERKQYFIEKPVHPTVQQGLSFARAVILMLKNEHNIPLKKRRERATKHCLANCVFHASDKKLNSKIVNLVSRLVGLKDSLSYPEEEYLGTCRACGCDLQAKTKFSTEAAIASIGPENIDSILRTYKEKSFSKCWMLKESLESPRLVQILRDKMSRGTANGVQHLNTYQAVQKAEERQNGKN